MCSDLLYCLYGSLRVIVHYLLEGRFMTIGFGVCAYTFFVAGCVFIIFVESDGSRSCLKFVAVSQNLETWCI